MLLKLVGVLLILGSVCSGGDIDDERDKGFHRKEILDKHGRYCAVRPIQQCCPGRDDTCTMPIEDTLCYCDMFCNRTSPDCCPDFVGHCLDGDYKDDDDDKGRKIEDEPQALGQGTPTTIKNNCYHLGRLHSPEDEIIVNCNNCTCVDAILKVEFNWKCTQKTCLIRHELLHHVNADTEKNGWFAQNYSKFWGLSLEDGVKYRLGTRRPTSHVTQMSILQLHDKEELPDSFDSRTEWPGLISPVLDQGNCGSSWAFSTAGVASDRLRIHSNGVHNETLSPQHFISCNNDHGQHGCGSGHVDRAWWFMRKVGVVNLQCFPYTSGNSKTSKNCPLPRTYAALKKATCPEKGAKLKVYQASPPYKIAPNEQQIMAEIIKNGPVQAVMEVKEDFYMYKTGVYRHSLPAEYQSASQRQAHFHSVRLIGWGTDESDSERPLKYWLCANSWGTDWGEDGFFRIQRGTNESGIESAILAVWLKANERMLVQKRSHHKTEPERPHQKIRHHNNRDNAF